MIKIIEKKDCCGCGACVQRCLKQCISMDLDNEGFYYPVIDKTSCIDCGLCEKVCPVINQGESREPMNCFAARGKREDIVKKSSSAGIFYLIAEQTINNGGVVFGARFNESWDVVHSWTGSLDDIIPFMSSKYVQSNIGDCYKQAEQFLRADREVLFTGTPCQLSGLRNFLRKEYNNLICVDVICHGVPGPGVWREYLKYVISPIGRKNTVSSSFYSPLSEGDAHQIKGISFRDKRLGWKKYSFVLLSSQGDSRSEENSVSSSNKILVRQKHYYNLFMKAFLHDYMLRPSCYSCPARKGKSGSDLLLGDYWGIARYYPEFFSPEGVSMALAYTEKGRQILSKLDLDTIEILYSETSGNSNIEFDGKMPADRNDFFEEFQKEGIKALYKHNKKLEKHIILVFMENIIHKLKTIIK